MALISFIVPAFNEERLLGRMLSAIGQVGRALAEPIEVIVDDASTDRTAAAAREHRAHVVSVKCRQIAATRNAGATAAHGVQPCTAVRHSETVPEQLKLDRETELEAVAKLNKYIATCVELGDNGSRELLEEILVSEEEHLDWLERQLNLIATIGEAHYVAQQVRDG